MITTNPIHQPCPDLPAYGLTKEQKARGLEQLKLARSSVATQVMGKLREEFDNAKSGAQRAAINRRLQRLQRNWI